MAGSNGGHRYLGQLSTCTGLDGAHWEFTSEVGGVKPKVPGAGTRLPSSMSSSYRVTRTRRVTCVTSVTCRACDVARARQINWARPVRGFGNQAEATAIWADFPPATLLTLVPHVSRLMDTAMYFRKKFAHL